MLTICASGMQQRDETHHNSSVAAALQEGMRRGFEAVRLQGCGPGVPNNLLERYFPAAEATQMDRAAEITHPSEERFCWHI